MDFVVEALVWGDGPLADRRAVAERRCTLTEAVPVLLIISKSSLTSNSINTHDGGIVLLHIIANPNPACSAWWESQGRSRRGAIYQNRHVVLTGYGVVLVCDSEKKIGREALIMTVEMSVVACDWIWCDARSCDDTRCQKQRNYRPVHGCEQNERWTSSMISLWFLGCSLDI